MSERRNIGLELLDIEREMKDLQILYERYFAGTEKREPIKAREKLARSLRQFANRRIVQTDLRFRYQNLAVRFHSYSGYWDRILRLMDEGRFIRGSSALPKAPAPAPPAAAAGGEDEVDRLLTQLQASGSGAGFNREKVARFLGEQRDKIKQTFGDQQVEFRVVVEDGKPRIKVRAKK
ncbi:MXAN_5187 C-terminal domain-containing protein [Geoalkalibacter halelectricus]|uniref:Uncharacterized protein n=1 Tax=Geoalkalibacter halelectricus TaxID=2847045 RepID=A0ABY5ZQQ4_9BACT|nr:MXAN_5187 C-terminal domain-containing protein [Geoalkalibacter halelectricus]MDO3377722.1 hypothetical protein [Geoalkalibacter halelectricus]UWZ81510.1 hypothetical protein L9S41_08960 [Geoalkalibacter halelectricus]